MDAEFLINRCFKAKSSNFTVKIVDSYINEFFIAEVLYSIPSIKFSSFIGELETYVKIRDADESVINMIAMLAEINDTDVRAMLMSVKNADKLNAKARFPITISMLEDFFDEIRNESIYDDLERILLS